MVTKCDVLRYKTMLCRGMDGMQLAACFYPELMKRLTVALRRIDRSTHEGKVTRMNAAIRFSDFVSRRFIGDMASLLLD